jgi:hypothetical protein
MKEKSLLKFGVFYCAAIFVPDYVTQSIFQIWDG